MHTVEKIIITNNDYYTTMPPTNAHEDWFLCSEAVATVDISDRRERRGEGGSEYGFILLDTTKAPQRAGCEGVWDRGGGVE